MEDISKSSSPRTSVSMPSLDAADDFSDGDINADTNSGFISNDSSFVAVSSVQTFISTDVLSDSAAFTTLPTTETSQSDQISADESSEILQQDETLDSQSEEDPSIALDQFIQKIADEQLNSKRMDASAEEAAQDGDSQPSSDQNLDSESNEPLDMDVDTKNSSKDETTADSLVQQDSNDSTSIQSDSEKTNELLQDECIEEIQKEIDKIPPRKTDTPQKSSDSPVQNGQPEDTIKSNKTQNDTQESIERMLCDDDENIFKNKVDVVKQSSEALEDPDFIEKAQEEIKKLDILVCGECHNTFYLIEEFVQHKKRKCQKKNNLILPKDNLKCPQVWGFILWKLKQNIDSDDHLSQWSMYQKWCKLSDDDKSIWIMAGESIQFAGKIANSQIIQMKKNETNISNTTEYRDGNKQNAAPIESNTNNIMKKGLNKAVKLNNDVTIMPSTKHSSAGGAQNNVAIRTTKVLSTQKQEFVVEKIVAKRFNPRKKTWEYSIKWENFGPDANTWEPVSNLSHCKQLVDQFEEQLKRMKEEKAKQTASPKGRGRPPANKQYKPYVPIAPKIHTSDSGMLDDSGSTSRPQRSSKQKALNQVKAWCGNISDEDSFGGKRKHEDDDSDEDYDEKRVKMEEDSEDSDKDGKAKSFNKKISIVPKIQTPITIKNGSTSTSQQILPSNILIPDANGVVRINQKQLPSLSSGVYIMSKTAGIIKLDSSTSKVATSGGQTIVKVAPKIGQTQIKIVKKEGNSTKQIIQVSPKSNFNSPIKVTPVKVTNTKINKIRKEIKKVPTTSTPNTTTKVLKKIFGELAPQSKSDVEEDTDDGLEPLPFPEPTDPLPTPESPPAEFVLDPATGKIAGQEYVDKPVVIKEEPQPVPVPALVDVENIVQLAAADITEDDLENADSLESQGDLETYITKSHDIKPTIIHTIKTESGSGAVKRVVKYTTSGQGMNDGSILNKALTHTAQRTVMSSGRSPAVAQQRVRIGQQKVINSMVGQRGAGASPAGVRTVVRQVMQSPQSSQGNVRTRTVMSKPKYQVNQKPLPSPLQPTRTYAAAAGVRQQIQSSGVTNRVPARGGYQLTQSGELVRRPAVARTVTGQPVAQQRQQTVQYSQRQPGGKMIQRVVSKRPEHGQQQVTRTVSPTKPKTVINMPSLTDDDSTIHTAAKPKSQMITSPQVSTATVVTKSEPILQAEYTEAEATNEEVETNTANEIASSSAPTSEEAVTDWSSFTMADSDSPIYVTGDDGTIYQVAGQNEQGQTILITQGPDGQQQCLLVTNEIGETGTEDTQAESEAETVLGLSNTLNQEAELASEPVTDVTDPLQIKTNITDIEGIEDTMQDDQVVAQVVRAEPPSPGGTHKVVVMLPDGNLMLTQVSPEEYASLELE